MYPPSKKDGRLFWPEIIFKLMPNFGVNQVRKVTGLQWEMAELHKGVTMTIETKNTNPFVPVLAVLSLVAGATATGVASAATISFSTTYDVVDAGNPLFAESYGGDPAGTANSTKTVTGANQLSQFDASLGTLTGVSFELTSDLSKVSLELYGDGSEGGVEGKALASFTQTVSSGITAGDQFSQMFNLETYCSSFDSCSDVDNIQPTSFTDIFSVTTAGYTGTGMFDVFFMMDNALSVEVLGGFYASADFYSAWKGDIKLTYTYDESAPEVPVPAAVWLFGSGLLGLVGIARRKKTI